MSILVVFGKRVCAIRKKLNLTQEQLAFKANVHRTYIGMIERGEKNISLENIQKISNALDTKIYKLFKGL